MTMDLTIVPNPADACATQNITNGTPSGQTDRDRGSTVQIFSTTNLNGVTTDHFASPLSTWDWETVQVRPLTPDLTTSFGSGTGSVTPGEATSHHFVIQNHNVIGNPVDTARNVVATFTVPTVTANGIQNTLLALQGVDAPGGSVAYQYDGGGNLVTATV